MSTQTDYYIENVLGEKFRTFISMLSGQNYDQFLFKNYAPEEMKRNPLYKPDDIHYDFTQTYISILEAFRKLEQPDLSKKDIESKFTENVKEQIVSDQNGSTTFEFKQLPYLPTQTYLVEGFNMLPFNDKVYPTYTKSHTANSNLKNMIIYIMHLIALLDLSKIKIAELKKDLLQDNQFFKFYVPFLTSIYNKIVFPSDPTQKQNLENSVKDIVNNALDSIIESIVGIYKQEKYMKKQNTDNLGLSSFKSHTFKFNSVQYADGDDKIKMGDNNNVSDLFVLIRDTAAKYQSGNATDWVAVTKELVGVLIDATCHELKTQGKDATIAKIGGGITQQEINDAPKKAILNWHYMLDYTGGGGGLWGPGTGTGSDNFDFLYGPVHNVDNKKHLLDIKTQGGTTDGALVDENKLKHIKNVINAIESLADDKATTTSTKSTTAQYAGRIFLLTILMKELEFNTVINDGTPKGFDNGQVKKLIDAAVDAINKYGYVLTRFNAINDCLSNKKIMRKLSDDYAIKIGVELSLKLKLDENDNLVERQVTPSTKPTGINLANSDINRFFYNHVLLHEIYENFFNLIDARDSLRTDVKFAELKDKQRSPDLQHYRLNVKKIRTNQDLMMTGGYLQRGGAGSGSYGDIMLLKYIPPVTPNISGIWVTYTLEVPHDVITRFGTKLMKEIQKNVYIEAAGGKVKLFNDDNLNIDVNVITVQSAKNISAMRINHKLLYDQMINDSNSLWTTANSTSWAGLELKLAEHTLKEASKWERVFDENDPNYGYLVYPKIDANGNKTFVKFVEDGTCDYISSNNRRCLDILMSCAGSKFDDKSITGECKAMMEESFDGTSLTNVDVTDISKKISEISPDVALNVLRRFHFGSYLSEEETFPFNGFRRYRIQDVASWLREMKDGSDPSKKITRQKPLKKIIGDTEVKKILGYAEDKSKHPFFTYLQILVSWVNANYQILNPEEFKNTTFVSGNYLPESNKSYNIYQYSAPISRITLRSDMRNLTCGLERLKNSIINDVTGVRASSLISNIASMPLNIDMPFNRNGFVYPVRGGASTMYGGNGSNLESELKKINENYGYGLFNKIYDSLKESMRHIESKQIKIKNTTNEKIMNKLNSLKQVEDELRKSLVGLIERNRLYKASRGYINTYEMDDTEFTEVLKKHSNLLSIGSVYNKKARNLIDLFQTIANAISDKIETPQTQTPSAPSYIRPIRQTYNPIR